MTPQELMQAYGQSIGMSSLVLNENGLARLRFDGLCTVDFEEDAEQAGLHIYANMGGIEGNNVASEYLFRRMLQAHFLGRETGGACYGINETGETGDELNVFQHVLTAGMTVEDFTLTLQLFVASMSRLRQIMDDAQTDFAREAALNAADEELASHGHADHAYPVFMKV